MTNYLPGAEPASFEGGPTGVLVLHGYTGNPSSMRGVAEAMAAAGHTVELPVLPGHGTSVEDMIPTRFSDYSSHVEAVYEDLAGRTERVFVIGLSMGGTLTAWLASRHPELAGIVCINAAVQPDPAMLDFMKQMVAAGDEVAPGVGSDIADPDVVEVAYESSPVEALVSMMEAVADLAENLSAITSPALIVTSTNDHVVPAASSDFLAEQVSGPVERATFERSFHVITLDYDRAEVERLCVDFVARHTSP